MIASWNVTGPPSFAGHTTRACLSSGVIALGVMPPSLTAQLKASWVAFLAAVRRHSCYGKPAPTMAPAVTICIGL